MISVYLEHVRRDDVAQIREHVDCLVEFLLNYVSFRSQNSDVHPFNSASLDAVIALSQRHVNDRPQFLPGFACFLLRIECLLHYCLDVRLLLLLLGLLEQLIRNLLLDFVAQIQVPPVLNVALDELWKFK